MVICQCIMLKLNGITHEYASLDKHPYKRTLFIRAYALHLFIVSRGILRSDIVLFFFISVIITDDDKAVFTIRFFEEPAVF